MTRNLLHIALIVESLRQAENLYTNLFSLRVIGRDAESPAAMRFLPVGTDSTDSDPREFRRSILEGNGFCLCLSLGFVESPGTGRVDHIGFCCSEDDLRQIRQRASELSCRVLAESLTELLLEDPLGICWKISAFPAVAG